MTHTHEQLLAHGESLRRLARSLVADAGDAEDLVQATYLTALEHSAVEVRSLRAWMKTIVLNRFRSDRRRNANKRRHSGSPRSTVACDPAEAFEQTQIIRRLTEAVSSLPNSYRDVVILRYYEALDVASVAERLQLPKETVRTRLRRALAQLRRETGLSRRGERSRWLAALLQSTSEGTVVAKLTAAPAIGFAIGSAKLGALIAVVVLALVAVWIFDGDDSADADLRRPIERTRVEPTRAPMRSPLAAEREAEIPAIDLPKEAAAAAPPAATSTATPTDIRITVEGRAVDSFGDPVIGARIELESVNGTASHIASTTSDARGRFRFDDQIVPPQRESHDTGYAMLFGLADGYAFAWHGMRAIHRGERPPGRPKPKGDDSYFRGESLSVTLVFQRAEDVEGVVVDEAGVPIGDVEISLASCDFIDTEGKHAHRNFREFWGLNRLPLDRRRATSDSKGRFALHGLPREMLLLLWARHPERATKGLSVVTTDRDPSTLNLKPNSAGAKNVVIERSHLTVVMPTTRALEVTCVHPWSGAPIAAARVSVYRRDGEYTATHGKTDPQGEVVLRLPAGKFRVCVDPPAGDELIRTYDDVEVLDEAGAQSVVVTLDMPAIVVFDCVDGVTGDPVAGVSFMLDEGGRSQTIQSSLSIVDHPKTGEDGKMKVLMRPGKAVVWPFHPDYQYLTRQVSLELVAGETKVAKFELQPRSK